jgi:hypothetical protein
MLHVADVINFVFFCMHALQFPEAVFPSTARREFVAEATYKSTWWLQGRRRAGIEVSDRSRAPKKQATEFYRQLKAKGLICAWRAHFCMLRHQGTKIDVCDNLTRISQSIPKL